MFLWTIKWGGGGEGEFTKYLFFECYSKDLKQYLFMPSVKTQE